MRIILGCKRWSGGGQQGFRVYAPGIRDLVPRLVFGSTDERWDSLGDFYERVVAGEEPDAYSRAVVVWDGTRQIEVTETIASHGRSSVQGYITAPRGSWLFDFVEANLDQDIVCDYEVQPEKDLILIPTGQQQLEPVITRRVNEADRKIRAFLSRRRSGPPPDAAKIGLYFEIVEFEALEADLLGTDWQVQHRYPAIDSQLPILRDNNVSCDLDLIQAGTAACKCVEVKSVGGAPGSPFQLSRRENASRIWCTANNIPYDIVVYYHARLEVIERRVIPVNQQLRIESSGYWCFP